jgi:hypothetical protein
MDQVRQLPRYLRRIEASAYLREIWGLSYAASTLTKMCYRGDGPETFYCGRDALHTPAALDAFARSRIKPGKAR